MSGFDDYRGPKRRGGGKCFVCGGLAEGRVAIALQAREKVEGRTVQDANAYRYPTIDSTSHTYCEACAIKTYEATKATLEQRVA